MSRAMETAIKMLESLPLQVQEHVVEEASDEARWDELFERKTVGLVAGALKARGMSLQVRQPQ